MKTIILFMTLFAGVFAFINFTNTKAVEAVGDIDSPIVLEMFTSQSCSSCPPADRLLGQLASENDNIIALSCNVTYWNHLHWKDTLSHEFCTARQRQYVQNLRSRGPYTPQIVINGRDTMVGSQGGKIANAIQQDLKNNKVSPINLKVEGDNLSIRLPETAGNDSYALHLVVYNEAHQQSIPSGENRGRTVTYTNPVQQITSLGTWDGTGKNMTHDVSQYSTSKGFAVLAQKNSKTGPIIAAGKVNK